MRLVLEYDVTDGFTYDCTVTLPIESESPEAALCELEELVMAAVETNEYFSFCGYELSHDNFTMRDDEDLVFMAPRILTLDEWFAAPR